MIIDPGVADEANKSRVKISPSVTERESDGVTFDVSFNAKLRLPRFSDRVEPIVDSMSKEESAWTTWSANAPPPVPKTTTPTAPPPSATT